MPRCPGCQSDHEEGHSRCPACGAELVAAASSMEGTVTAPRPGEPWEAVATVARPEQAAILQGLLESAGIPCEVLDRTLSEMPLPFASTYSSLGVMVPASRADEAAALLDEPPAGIARCPACSHLGAPEDPACEYCGAPAR